ncbi:tetratricopeptide repeat-containing glycosyltransferase family 2 protein [Cytobacillus sp. Hm23]
MRISLTMIVKNEERYIERCIKSAIGLVDEIVVVDTGSSDNTLEILTRFNNVALYHYDWCDDFSLARNFAIKKATGDYIFVLDADEYVVKGSRSELEFIMDNNLIGRIQIDSHFKKDNQLLHSKAYVSRFFPRDIRFTGAVHEQLDSEKPRVKLDLVVYHDGYFQTNKSHRNIPLLLKTLKKQPTETYYLFQLGKELRITKQFNEAFYFLKKSYELINKAAPYYGELVIELISSGKECGKEEVLSVIKQNENLLDKITDYHFAKGLYYMDISFKSPEKAEAYIPKIEESYKRCIELQKKDYIEYVQGSSSFLPLYNLGVFYEVTGNLNKALDYYEQSAAYGYELAISRIKALKRG